MTTKGEPLSGKIAVVAGATRGAGRGIATALGEAGATVYCTGRSIPGSPGMKNRLETIHETAEIVTARGGRGIPVRVDHTVPGEVTSLFERVGEFDLLVKRHLGRDDLVEWGKKLWETKLEDGLALIDRAIKTHIITSYRGAVSQSCADASPDADDHSEDVRPLRDVERDYILALLERNQGSKTVTHSNFGSASRRFAEN